MNASKLPCHAYRLFFRPDMDEFNEMIRGTVANPHSEEEQMLRKSLLAPTYRAGFEMVDGLDNNYLLKIPCMFMTVPYKKGTLYVMEVVAASMRDHIESPEDFRARLITGLRDRSTIEQILKRDGRYNVKVPPVPCSVVDLLQDDANLLDLSRCVEEAVVAGKVKYPDRLSTRFESQSL